MDLVCYLIDDHPVDIRPADNRRQWMDDTPDSYAYRCLPLSIANAHGWEVRCPATCEAEWNGGSGKDDIHIAFEDEEGVSQEPARTKRLVESHFGSGVLTFNVGALLRTSPGYDLWITGPVNAFKDGIQALSAVIETYWMPFVFTMNWKFTRPNVKVRFEKGEPFCFFFPIEHGLLERVNPRVQQVSEEPGLERQYNFALGKRAFLSVLKILGGPELKIDEKERKRLDAQGWYMRGQMPDGTKVIDHRKSIHLKPFDVPAGRSHEDRTTDPAAE